MFEAVVEREFAAAHALRLPDGSCEPLHGHNWRVEVAVARGGLDELETVMDFHRLGAALDAAIAPYRDRCLNDVPPFDDGGYNPSAERVAQVLAERVAAELPTGVTLASVSVTEAPGCRAVFRGQVG